MKTKLLEYAKEVAKEHQVTLIYLTMGGSHVSGIRNPKGDIDLYGVYVSPSITSNYISVKDYIMPDERGNARYIDIKLYNIHYIGWLVQQQRLFGYRYFINNDDVILPCPKLTKNIPRFYRHEAATNSMLKFLWTEIKELEYNQDKMDERYLYKQSRYIIQDIGAISNYIQKGKISALTFRSYLDAKLSLPFRLVLLKRLKYYDKPLTYGELRLVYYEMHRMRLDIQQKWRVHEIVPYKEIETFVDGIVAKYTSTVNQ